MANDAIFIRTFTLPIVAQLLLPQEIVDRLAPEEASINIRSKDFVRTLIN